jgi:peptidoglycan/LPS O-acetylase OafA/YrhL
MLAFRVYDRFARAYWPTVLPSSYHFGLVVLKFVIAGTFAITVAYLSRRYFEEWFLQRKDRIVWREPSPEASQEEIAGLPAAS